LDRELELLARLAGAGLVGGRVEEDPNGANLLARALRRSGRAERLRGYLLLLFNVIVGYLLAQSSLY
jgi:hypothetical protein